MPRQIPETNLEILKRLQELGRTRRKERGKLSTGIAALDHLLGGGFDCGTLNLLYGPSGCGKSATVGKIIGYAAEHLNCVSAFIDADHTIESAVAFYGSLEDLQESVLIHEPQGESEGIEVAVAMARAADLVVVDSLGAFHDGMSRSLVREATRDLADAADASGCVVICTNHVRMDIKAKKTKSAGGIGPIYFASKVIRLGAQPLRGKGQRIGCRVTGLLEKAKTGPMPGAEASWDLEYLK